MGTTFSPNSSEQRSYSGNRSSPSSLVHGGYMGSRILPSSLAQEVMWAAETPQEPQYRKVTLEEDSPLLAKGKLL